MEKDYSVLSLKNSLSRLKSRILDEIDAPILLSIKPERAKLFENPSPFGQEVFDKFPTANFDIEEACKCFALARYTACVMHLQRVMEKGLKAYGKYFEIMDLIPSGKPTWSDVLVRALKETKNRDDKGTWESPEERDFFDGIYPFLMAVKNAWRNPAMHAEKSYGEAITEDIFNTVKGFMRYLAEHLDESGKFTP